MIIDNCILIIIKNTLKPLHNKGFHQGKFFLENPGRFNGLRAVSHETQLWAGYDTNAQF